MRNKVIISAALMLACAGAFAQNLNPVVEVTNIYAREATGIEKPSQLLQLPDSVLRFNLDMDYSVQNTPYQGAYEFKPYLVQLKPQPRTSDEGTLFVRLGAGYGLHPEATVIWTPVKTSHFRLNVFGDHHSYIGQYRIIAEKDKRLEPNGTFRDGVSMRSAIGADMLYTWAGGSVSADVQYKNIYATNVSQGAFSNNVWQGNVRVQSAPANAFQYSFGTRVNYISVAGFDEFHNVTNGSVGLHIGNHRFILGLSEETVVQPDGYVGSVGILPTYLLNVGDFSMRLGIKGSFLFRSADDFCPQSSGYVFPNVDISYNVIPDYMALFAFATGGDNIISYDKLLTENPFMRGFQWHTDNMVTRVNAGIGIRGNIVERFHYNLKVGYSLNSNAWTWGMTAAEEPMMGYATPLHTLYGLLDAGWKDENLDIGVNVYYGYTPIPDLKGQILFAPAPLKASAYAFYNWGGRIKAGITAQGRSDMPGPVVLPGYVDLGVEAKLQMTRTLGLWIKGGNLLNQTIQYVPFYAEKGIYFTLGATLSL